MKNKINLFGVSVIWFINAGIRFATICSDIYYDTPSKTLFMIHCLVFVSSLIAAIVFLIRHHKTKRQTEND